MHTSQRPIWSLIRRLICLSVGLCLAAGALVFMLQVEVARSPSAAIAVRLLVVMAAGMIVGAATGRVAYAVLGSAIGMIAGDVMYVRLFRPNVATMWFGGEFLLNPVLAVSILPGALASERNRIAGAVVSLLLAAAPLVAIVVMAVVSQSMNPSDIPQCGGPGFAVVLIGPAMMIGGIAWLVAAAVVAGIEWLRARRKRSTCP
ncbi:MAG: hypothetical protein RBS80_18330 [Thermoguttaceae bacterium]|jgi:hypothetical protein|nr:hypothetical protein [Thermoguttaceae bacterium]